MFRCASRLISLKHIRQRVYPRTFNAKGANLVEVVAVQVSIDTEEPPEDRPDGIPEVLWERGA